MLRAASQKNEQPSFGFSFFGDSNTFHRQETTSGSLCPCYGLIYFYFLRVSSSS
jgi:hypothetical protein